MGSAMRWEKACLIFSLGSSLWREYGAFVWEKGKTRILKGIAIRIPVSWDDWHGGFSKIRLLSFSVYVNDPEVSRAEPSRNLLGCGSPSHQNLVIAADLAVLII